jgi:O-antigen/teichoic acid export membrane protein
LSLINADQQQWRLTKINLVYQVGVTVTKLAILWFTRNYILFLAVESLFAVWLNVAVIRKANRLYPWIATREKLTVDPGTRRTIRRNAVALFLHSLGGYMVHSTDNIVISSFVSISMVGLYSNYTLISSYATSWMSQILNSFSESVGNLIASESRERVYSVFKTVFLVNFIVISIPMIVLANVITPFIVWWLGGEYILAKATVAVILLNMFVVGMRSSALTFKSRAGLFTNDRFSPLIQGVINLVLSLWWVRLWGITGVLVATTVSMMAVGCWQYPRLIYKHTFHKPLRLYFAAYARYAGLTAVALGVSWWLCGFLASTGLWAIVARGVISTLVPVAIYWAALRRAPEMRTLVGDYIKPSMTKIFRR